MNLLIIKLNQRIIMFISLATIFLLHNQLFIFDFRIHSVFPLLIWMHYLMLTLRWIIWNISHSSFIYLTKRLLSSQIIRLTFWTQAKFLWLIMLWVDILISPKMNLDNLWQSVIAYSSTVLIKLCRNMLTKSTRLALLN